MSNLELWRFRYVNGNYRLLWNCWGKIQNDSKTRADISEAPGKEIRKRMWDVADEETQEFAGDSQGGRTAGEMVQRSVRGMRVEY